MSVVANPVRICLAALLTACAIGGGAEAKVLNAGVAAVEVSPPSLPVILSGGFLPNLVKESNGRLFARALVLDDGSRRIVISVVDSLMMPRELLDDVKDAASRSTGIPTDRMLISATHTHSAPPLMGALGTDANPEYSAFVRAQLIRVIEEAARAMRPARAGWAVESAPGYTHCRRWILRPDKMRKDPFGDLNVRANMHPGYQNPDFIGPAGPTDPDLSVLAIQSADGKPMALLANYSMHYVGSDRGVSPDYYGPFCENIRARLGVSKEDAGFIAMMSQGTSGDQHWMDYSRPKKDVTNASYAEALARIAYEAYQKIRFREWVPVDLRETRLTLARRVADDDRLRWAREVMAAAPGGIPRNQREVYAREQILMAGEPRRELRLQAVRIGDLGIAAWPNEVFAISGLRIKAQSPLQPTFNIELANGAEGYIPPPEQHRLGGYTTWPARTAGLEAGAEPRIVEALLGLLEQVSLHKRRPVEEARGGYAKAVLAGRPAAYWRGNEMSGARARDASGNSRTGEYTGPVALFLEGPEAAGLSEAGRVNRAPHYAGGHLKASVPATAAAYSVSMWFSNGLPANARPTTGVLYSYGADHLSIGGTAGAAGKLVFESEGTTLEGRSAMAMNTWHFVVISRDKAGVRIFLDGHPEAELSGTAPELKPRDEFRVAAGEGQGTSFEGRIDEVAVFPRVLSARESAMFYQRAALTSGEVANQRQVSVAGSRKD